MARGQSALCSHWGYGNLWTLQRDKVKGWERGRYGNGMSDSFPSSLHRHTKTESHPSCKNTKTTYTAGLDGGDIQGHWHTAHSSPLRDRWPHAPCRGALLGVIESWMTRYDREREGSSASSAHTRRSSPSYVCGCLYHFLALPPAGWKKKGNRRRLNVDFHLGEKTSWKKSEIRSWKYVKALLFFHREEVFFVLPHISYQMYWTDVERDIKDSRLISPVLTWCFFLLSFFLLRQIIQYFENVVFIGVELPLHP